ncbi:hypothetical protein HYV74_03090 [Candidatus Uhrbacteria bacterium]|nr:hypothetical protein [Candidatus Uhrbacteria bacterium]
MAHAMAAVRTLMHGDAERGHRFGGAIRLQVKPWATNIAPPEREEAR